MSNGKCLVCEKSVDESEIITVEKTHRKLQLAPDMPFIDQGPSNAFVIISLCGDCFSKVCKESITIKELRSRLRMTKAARLSF